MSDITPHAPMDKNDPRGEIRIGFPGPSSPPDLGNRTGRIPESEPEQEADKEAPAERRRFIRVAKPVDFELRYLDRPLAASMIDISEGGMRCRVEPGEEFDPEKVVRARVDLGDGNLEVRGLVSWEKMLDGSTEVGVGFVGLTERESQRIRSHGFVLQIAQRRAESSHHVHHHRSAHSGRRR